MNQNDCNAITETKIHNLLSDLERVKNALERKIADVRPARAILTAALDAAILERCAEELLSDLKRVKNALEHAAVEATKADVEAAKGHKFRKGD